MVRCHRSAFQHQRAMDALAESVAAARVAKNGVSVAEIKRRAYAGCKFDVDPHGNAGGLFQRSLNQQDADASRVSCINSYIYGDGLMYESMPDLLGEWVFAILKLLAIVIVSGFAAGIGLVGSTTVAKSWWRWCGDRDRAQTNVLQLSDESLPPLMPCKHPSCTT